MTLICKLCGGAGAWMTEEPYVFVICSKCNRWDEDDQAAVDMVDAWVKVCKATDSQGQLVPPMEGM